MLRHIIVVQLPRLGIFSGQIEERHQSTVLGCSFGHCFLLAFLSEHDRLFARQMDRQSHDDVRFVLQLELRQSPVCFWGADISSVNECLDFVVLQRRLTAAVSKALDADLRSIWPWQSLYNIKN